LQHKKQEHFVFDFGYLEVTHYIALFLLFSVSFSGYYSRICLIRHRLIRHFVTFSSVPAEFLSFVYIYVR